MKKNLILSLLFAAACSFAGFNSAQAQTVKGVDVPAMQADVQTMADEVMANQLNDPDEANKTFSKLVKKIKNDKEQLVAVGNFFLEKKIYPCANQCAKQAYTLDPQYVPGLMLQAQVCMLRKDWGGAGQKFDEILNIQPDNIEALRLSARVYKYVNPIVAKEALEKILEREPNNLTAYKELGDIAYTASEYKDAAAAYKKFFDGTPNPTIDDVHAGENYLLSLMNQSDFTTIKEMANKLLPLAPSDLILRRMLFYAQVETMDFEHAKESIAYLSDSQYPDSAFLYRDYIYAASFAADGLDLELHEESLTIPEGVEVYEINGPFFFGIANSFEQMTAEMQDHPAIRVIRMRKVPFIDSTGVHNLETLCRMSRRDGTRIILSGVRPEVREVLSRTGFPELIGEGNICSHISIALRRAEQMVEAHRGTAE